MGVYNTYGEVQLKVGNRCLAHYNIGDKVDIPDSVYVGHEGFVVIVGGVFVALFDHIHTKWGDEMCPGGILTSHNYLRE